MSNDQDECEWVSVSSGTGPPGRAGPKAVKPVVCVCVLPPTLISGAVVTVQ